MRNRESYSTELVAEDYKAGARLLGYIIGSICHLLSRSRRR